MPDTEAPQREFASVLITLDPALQRNIAMSEYPDAEVQKFVFSSQPVLARLSALFDYYNAHFLAHAPSTLELIADSGATQNPVFVLQTSRGTEILLSMGLLGDITQHPDFGDGSLQVAFEKVVEVVARTQQARFEETGSFSLLLMIDFEFGAIGSRNAPLNPAPTPAPKKAKRPRR